ncbi:MAG: hypothetical protein AB1846_12425 [Chloroflexota bacterium]
MTTDLEQFTFELDTLLGLQSGQVADTPTLQAASALIQMRLDADAAPQHEFRSRWVSRTIDLASQYSARSLFAVKWTWAAALILVFALLVAFRQPVFAAIGRWLGYIYIPDSGFLPADTTLVLAQPVVQQHDGRALLAQRGVATPGETTLYLEYSDIASSADGARLEIPTGEIIPLSWWEYSPYSPDAKGVRLIFPALPVGVTQMILALPEGWRLPLTWIPAAESGLPDVQVVPYPTANTETPFQTDICQEMNGMSLCVLAATTSVENTSVLVESRPTIPDLRPSWVGTVWQTETALVTLRDERGNSYQMLDDQGNTLMFPPLPAGQQVTLNIPAFLARVDLPEQTIVVDMGDDPRPDTVIPLDIGIQVLGSTVHFSRATFTGDGVNSLRLILDADPVQTVDGITPAAIEIGKPDRVDDLFGGGMLAGSKDIFIELVRSNGKITGVLTIPVVGATVMVDGPFDFTFNLPDAASITPTPVVADPNTFSPAPAPTPLPLDSYVFSDQSLQRGDLIFTAVNGENTDVYMFTPGEEAQPQLLATLPGVVSQIYIHLDHQGLDYLAGSGELRDGFSYVDNVRLYTIRFTDNMPRLLYNFASNPANTIGTTVYADWSFDGKYLAFRDSGGNRPGHEARFGWFDMSCRSSGFCALHEIPVNEQWSLSAPIFSPFDYRMLFSGADESGTGEPDVFLLDFDPDKPDMPIANLTTQIFISDGVNAPTWTPDGQILDICFDGMSWETNVFCIIDPSTGNVTAGELISSSLGDYRLYGGVFWIQPATNQIVISVFPKNGTRESLQELRLMDLNGHLGTKLAASQWISHVDFSPSGQWLAYATDEGKRLYLTDVNSGNSTLVQEFSSFPVPWIGWVR